MVSSRPRDNNGTMTFPGLYVGQVASAENDDDQYPGRIKVSIPSIFGASEENEEERLVWARPCFPYGHFFVPEEGDKVWLAFENGNPRAPVWLGVWYPEGTAPDAAQVSPPTKRVIESSSGHLIQLDDENGQVIIQDTNGNTVTLDDQGVTLRETSGDSLNVSSLKSWLQNFIDAFQTWTPPTTGTGDSGSALKTKLTTFFTSNTLPM